MKKIHFIGIGALAIAAAAIPGIVKKRIDRKKKEMAALSLEPGHTDYQDKDHLIFCDETQLSRRIIQLETTINMRDIGGYTGLDGRKTRWGRVIRSEELCHLSEADVKSLEAMGIKHVYDFRDPVKARLKTDRMPATADYTNLPVLSGFSVDHRSLDFDDPQAVDRFMRGIYAFQVKHKAQDYATILHTLTREEELPILYHCTNGKDRTGFMTALILLICGVPEATIISDYTLTNLTFDEAFHTLGAIMLDEMKDSMDIQKEKLRDFFGVKPEWLKIQLDYIKKHYGTVDAYLLANTDLTEADLDAVRANMLEPVE